MKSYPSRTLTDTWLFLARANHTDCVEAKVKAMDNIIEVFGSLEVAQIHFELFVTDSYPKTA